MKVNWPLCEHVLRRACNGRADSEVALKAQQIQSLPVAVPTRVRLSRGDEVEEIEDKLPLLEPFTHLSVNVPGSPPVSMCQRVSLYSDEEHMLTWQRFQGPWVF